MIFAPTPDATVIVGVPTRFQPGPGGIAPGDAIVAAARGVKGDVANGISCAAEGDANGPSRPVSGSENGHIGCRVIPNDIRRPGSFAEKPEIKASPQVGYWNLELSLGSSWPL